LNEHYQFDKVSESTRFLCFNLTATLRSWCGNDSNNYKELIQNALAQNTLSGERKRKEKKRKFELPAPSFQTARAYPSFSSTLGANMLCSRSLHRIQPKTMGFSRIFQTAWRSVDQYPTTYPFKTPEQTTDYKI